MANIGEERLTEDTYHDLQNRLRHLEGLVQTAFSLSGMLSEDNIMGDLREIARISVGADDVAVLMSDADYTDLSDPLSLGVPELYLEVCRTHLQSLPDDKRPLYLGNEVLLRERLPDMLPSATRVREAEAANAWSYMRLPLIVEQNLVGFVALFSYTPDQFNGAHLQLGRLFAAQVATAIRNMRLYLRLNQAEQRQQAVSKVARLIAEDMTLDMLLSRIVEEAVHLIEGHMGTVLLSQPDRTLVVRAVYGDAPAMLGMRLRPGAGQAGMVALTGQPNVITNYREWDNAIEAMRNHVNSDSILFGVPLIYQGRVLGVLQVVGGNPHSDAIQDQQDVLMMLAPQAATAIAKAQLHETVRQDRQQLLAILDHTSAVIVVCDAEGHVLLLNPEAQRVITRLGLDMSILRSKRIGEILEDIAPEQMHNVAKLGSVLEINLGQAGEYLVQIAPIERADGSVERYVSVAQDVSQLRRLDRMKTDLIHILSHDLRNPLGLARGSIDLIDEPDVTQDQRDQLKEMIISSLDRMDQLIQDVVDLEMADSLGHETAVPYQLSGLVKQVMKRNQGKAQLQHITLTYNELEVPPEPLLGHAVLVGQALDNLIGNAIKYTPEGGCIDVTLTIEDECAVVRVADTGYGIPKESLPYIFDQFFRVQDKRTRHIQGTGLGLSLVRAIAQAHGGGVTVESEIDKGSVFSLCLPLHGSLSNEPMEDQLVRLDLSSLLESDSGD